MTESIRTPEKRAEDFQAILKGRTKIEGTTKFGESLVREVSEGYLLDIPNKMTGIRAFFVFDGSGNFLYGDVYDDTDENRNIDHIQLQDSWVDDAIVTFQEKGGIDEAEKALAIEDTTEKIIELFRDKVIGLANITREFCQEQADKFQGEKPVVAPSVIRSLTDEEWGLIVEDVIDEVQEAA